MNTLVVSETKAKPGQETSLEGHLKGERWFNVAAFPTATFSIDSVVARPDSATTRLYDVTGTLTMKGTSGELSFPATIYQLENGSVRAQASFEFDRTKWGITAGSSNFFENLADNAVSDMVALSFDLTAVEK
jgi:polyisoprenoid-binding protein YceI